MQAGNPVHTIETCNGKREQESTFFWNGNGMQNRTLIRAGFRTWRTHMERLGVKLRGGGASRTEQRGMTSLRRAGMKTKYCGSEIDRFLMMSEDQGFVYKGGKAFLLTLFKSF